MVTHEEEVLCEECQKNRISWKKLLTSKTFWFSIITIIVSILSGFSNLDIIIQYPHLVSFLGTLIGILTLILRLMTATSVYDVKPILKESSKK